MDLNILNSKTKIYT